SLRADEALRWLARVYPSGTLASTSVLGSGATPALLLAGGVITLESVWSAPVLTAGADAVILTWRIHRAVDGLWRERQFGVGVFRDGQPVWSMESEPAFSFRGLPLG